MPKDVKKDEEKKKVKTTGSKVSQKKEEKQTTKKRVVSKKETDSSKKITKKEASKKTTKKESTKKPEKETEKEASLPKAKKASPKPRKLKSTAKAMLAEYYDLPYRYNQTIVKILAQTPTTLFVYWDISDEDRNALIKNHGENFFYETRPILIIHNVTKNYSFEIEINDFANSWYIRTQEPNCDYVIELGRRFNNQKGEYIYINSSNDIISPNDHILFENMDLKHVLFKNVKTSQSFSKNFGDLRFINNMDKLYGNIYDVYSALYDDELLNEISNPTSSEFLKMQ